MEQELIINSIKNRIEEGVPVDFSGMGVILVENGIHNLPITPLLSDENNFSNYKKENEIADFLFEISRIGDKRHDGFHVINLANGLLSISQYFSPPIQISCESTIYNVGARYRTAQYGSMCKGVLLIIVVAQTGLMSIAKNGIMEVLGQ